MRIYVCVFYVVQLFDRIIAKTKTAEGHFSERVSA
jgi:hypothetical protein